MREYDKNFGPGCGGLGNAFNKGGDYLMEGRGFLPRMHTYHLVKSPLFARMGVSGEKL